MMKDGEKKLLLLEITSKKNFPSERWEALKKFILQEIENINLDTTWTESEPEWWLDMVWVKAEILRRPQK